MNLQLIFFFKKNDNDSSALPSQVNLHMTLVISKYAKTKYSLYKWCPLSTLCITDRIVTD